MRIRWPFHVAQAGDRQVSVTLMLSEQNGKRLQFQVSKRTLFAFLAICAVALVLAIVGAAHLTSRTFSRRDKVPVWFTAFEQQRELSALQDENARLRKQLNQQIELTRQRISRANELIKRISSFTGMDFDGSASGGTSDTSKSATSQPDKLGRGGPLLPIEAGLSYIAVTSSRERNYDEARGLQVIQLDSVIGRLERAADHFDRQQRLLATTPLICPVRGDYTFSDRFGGRYHPVYRRRDFHTGLDVSASRGTAIVAPADGTVTTAHYDSAKGLTLTIDHGIGLFPHGSVLAERAFKTRYFHCSKLFVRKGSKVERGELIALVGSTGVSTGSHLHYEVLVNDQPVDPQFFILDRR